MIESSELILNDDDSIYHLNLKPEQLADKIILAGDPDRISLISSYFDHIEHVVQNREFITHTGTYKGTRISAIATGIGTDNIDIVLNELDALVNIDLKNRIERKEKKSLSLVRIGTCGSINSKVPSDEVVASKYAFGLDGLLNFYNFEMDDNEKAIHSEILEQCKWPERLNNPYLVESGSTLFKKMGSIGHAGITITAPGFYAPQGRAIRLQPHDSNLNERLRSFDLDGLEFINYEMETSALYGLAKLLGHEACTLCAVVANRYAKSFSEDYKPTIKKIIEHVLEQFSHD